MLPLAREGAPHLVPDPGREPGWAVPQVSREPSAQETMIPVRWPHQSLFTLEAR